MTVRRKPRRLSPITRRILAVNVLALAILVAGVLYLGEYRRNLIDAELAAMTTQAEMFAAALGEGAVIASDPEATLIARETARRMVRRLVKTSKIRARLFSAEGELIVDTERQDYPRGFVRREVLAPPGEKTSLRDSFFNLYNNILAWMPGDGDETPEYTEQPVQHGVDYGEVSRAIYGQNAAMVRALNDGVRILSVAVPVQRYKRILGAVMLSRDDAKIAAALIEVRLDILRISSAILAVTIILSLYLAGTIAQPLVRLARGADQLRSNPSRSSHIPDLSNRRDEIGDLSAALRDMTQALWDRMDAIERFAADVAHEIKNPLTSLRSAVETVRRIEDPERRAKLLSVIESDVLRLDRLISDIAEASRLDSELSKAEPEPVDLHHLIGSLVDAHATIHEGRAAHLAYRRQGDKPLVVLGTESRIGQVLRNLIDNALTFTPEDGRVTVTTHGEDDLVSVIIDDEGPGIPPGQESNVFERFYSERPEGEIFGTHSGLGLSIARQIIETYGGDIFAANIHDGDGAVHGARFTLRLPTPETE